MNPLRWIAKKVMRQPSCEEINSFLVGYLDGSLDPAVRARYERHLKECPPCHHFFDQYRDTVEMVKNADEVHVPDDLAQATLAFLREHKEG